MTAPLHNPSSLEQQGFNPREDGDDFMRHAARVLDGLEAPTFDGTIASLEALAGLESASVPRGAPEWVDAAVALVEQLELELEPARTWILAASNLRTAYRHLVPISARSWKAIRRQMVRMVQGYRHVEREIDRVLASCRHADGCPAVRDRAQACLADCPDREVWLSALVIRGNAEQYTILQSRLPRRVTGDYSPPSREKFDAIMGELEVLRGAGDVLAEIERYAREHPGSTASVADTEPAPPAPEKARTRLLEPHEETGAEDLDEELEHLADEDLDEDGDSSAPIPGVDP